MSRSGVSAYLCLAELRTGADEPEHPSPAITAVEAMVEEHEHGSAATVETTVERDEFAVVSTQEVKLLARVLGIGDLVVGAVGVVLAAPEPRKQSG